MTHHHPHPGPLPPAGEGAGEKIRVRSGSDEHVLEVIAWEPARGDAPGRLRFTADGHEMEVEYRLGDPATVLLDTDGRRVPVRLAAAGTRHLVAAGGCHLQLERLARGRPGAGDEAVPEVTPVMPAVVVSVLVAEGDAVEKGQPVVVLSAMKMESTLGAPRAGRVAEVSVAEGDKVHPGQVLVRIEAEDREPA